MEKNPETLQISLIGVNLECVLKFNNAHFYYYLHKGHS